jgi:hypothetical protein
MWRKTIQPKKPVALDRGHLGIGSDLESCGRQYIFEPQPKFHIEARVFFSAKVTTLST